MKQIFIVMTVRKYEGEWIEAVYDKEEDAQAHLDANPENNELHIYTYKVASEYKRED